MDGGCGVGGRGDERGSVRVSVLLGITCMAAEQHDKNRANDCPPHLLPRFLFFLFLFFPFLFLVCFTSYFVFSIAVLPHSPGVLYYHLLLR